MKKLLLAGIPLIARGLGVIAMATSMMILIATAPCVLAHSFPEEEHPSAGEKVTAPVSEIRIKYDAPIEKLFAKIEVLDAGGKNRASGAPELGSDGRELSLKVGALTPGDYSVKWSVVCVDSHHTEGSYTFTVARGGS